MTQTDERYEHGNLVLATTVLIKVGLTGEMRVEGGQVFWSYPHTERLQGVLDDFEARKCTVEPMEFSRSLRNMRKKVYELLGYDPPRVHQTAKPAA